MSELRIRIDQGELIGCKVTKDDFEYHCYNGIPYAKPPLGNLRFRDPQDPEPWDGVRDATVKKPMCPQKNLMLINDVVGSEDCLYINIKVPSSCSETSKLAVIVFIHDGDFRMGSEDLIVQGTEDFLKQDVILVTFNYRIGPLGFLCLNNSDVPGNAGLKDQVFALKWIKKNIEKFGGNPNNVTIYGENAGAACVHYLMLSPMAEGLFNSAIMQSGCCINSWTIQKNPGLNVLELAKTIGFDTKSKEKALEFLREAEVEDVVKAAHVEFSIPDTFKFLPVIERKIANVEPFLTKNPKNLLESGDYNKVPCIIGWNSCEGVIDTQLDLTDKEVDIENSLSKIDMKALIKEMCMTKNHVEIQVLCSKIQEFYSKSGKMEVRCCVDVISDIYFVVSTAFSGSLMSVHSPVYMYVSYLYKINSMRVGLPTLSSKEQEVSDSLVTLWTNFAKFQNPTPVCNEVITEQWTPFTSDDNNIFKIDHDMKMITNPSAERIQFWKNLLFEKETIKKNFMSNVQFWKSIEKS